MVEKIGRWTGNLPGEEVSELPRGYRAYWTDPKRRHPAIALDIRKRGGVCEGFSYALLVKRRFMPSGEITLMFTTEAVVIRGRHLKPLYDELVRHNVDYIQEFDPYGYDEPEEGETCIEGFFIEPV